MTPVGTPLVDIDEAVLQRGGFTDAGVQKFTGTVRDYASQLYKRAAHRGVADQAPGMPVEIGHDHVQAAAVSIQHSYGAPTRSGWSVAGQVGEYVATAVAGVGAGNLDKNWGVLAFGIAVSLAVILVVARLMTQKEN